MSTSFVGSGLPTIHVRSVALTAKDTSAIESLAGAVSIAAAFAGAGAGSLAIGASTAENRIDNTVDASILGATHGVFTSGSSDVGSNYNVTAERRGDVKLVAAEDATIQSVSFAASLAAAAGQLAISLAGAGATALNVINDHVSTEIVDSLVSAYGKTAVSSDGVTVGVTSADIVLSATNTSTIRSEVIAVSAAISGGAFAGAGSIGVALAKNLVGTSGAASGANTHGTYAAIIDSDVSATGDLTLESIRSETVQTLSAAGSVAIAVGIGGAGSATGTTSTTILTGDTHAWMSNSSAVTGGDVELNADSKSNVTKAVAVGASVAVAVGALSVAVTLVENTLDNDVRAKIEGTSSNHVAAVGNISVLANGSEMTIDDVTGVTASLSGGLVTASTGGLSLVNTIDNTIDSRISGAIEVHTAGNLAVHADETALIDADATAVTLAISLGAAVGVAKVDNRITSVVSATVTNATISGTDIDLIATSNARIEKTTTAGVAASLVGATTNLANAKVATQVSAIATGADITASEDFTIQANANNFARATANGGAFGAIAVGFMRANIDQGSLSNGSPEVLAEIGAGTSIRASGVNLGAQSKDDLLAKSVAAAGGAIALGGAISIVTSNQSALAHIGNGATIDANAINITSFADQNADSSADSLTVAAATGAGASATNTVLGDTTVTIDNAKLHSNVFTVSANNLVKKGGDVGANNIRGGSASGVGQVNVISHSDIGTTSNRLGSYVNINPSALIEVAGNYNAPGILQIQAATKADALDSVRLETASGYSLTVALSELESNTDSKINLNGATIVNRSGDISIATQSDIGLRSNSNLFSAALNAAAGASAKSVSDVDNTISVSGTTIRGAEVRLQSGRNSFQVPNLLSNFANIDVTTVSLGPSIAIGNPESQIEFTNKLDIFNSSKIEGFKDVLLISERNTEIPARATTDGLVLSLSGLPYGYPVSGASCPFDPSAGPGCVGRTSTILVSSDSHITAGIYNQSALLIRSYPIDHQEPALAGLLTPQRLLLTNPQLAGSASDPGLFARADYDAFESLGFTLDKEIPYHYAPLAVSKISLNISIDTLVLVKAGNNAGGTVGHYYRYQPRDSKGNLITELETDAMVLQDQNYADTSNWLDIGTTLPSGYNPAIDPPFYESDYTAAFEASLNGKFYLIKNPNLPSPTLSYRNVGNLLIKQREQVLAWMASHANNPEAIARYQVQLDQIDTTMADLGLVTQETVNGVTKQTIQDSFDAMFLDLPGIYAAPGSVFMEGINRTTATGTVEARHGASIIVNNASPFVPIVNDVIVKDNRRVAVVNQELKQFTPGNVFFNWVVEGNEVTGDGFGTSTITVTHNPSIGDFDVDALPTQVINDMYIDGGVINENGSVSIANPVGSINVSGEVRGASVTINSGKDFNLNTEDWVHTNRDPRQYINYQPLRASVFNNAGTTRLGPDFPTAASVVVPAFKTIKVFGIKITIKDGSSNANLQASIDKDESQILAQGAISITARYLNVNGLIQSGVQTITLGIAPNFHPSRSTSSLMDAKNNPLPGISFGDSSDAIADVPVSGYFDLAKQSIIVNNITPAGGRVTLAGQLLSTGHGKIVAAYGYASININNQSPYTLVMNKVDATKNRIGEIILIDSSLQTKTVYTRDAKRDH